MTTAVRFGHWPAEQPAPQLSAAETKLVRFLQGETVDLDAELAALIKREFDAAERYRMQRDAQIKTVVTRLLNAANGLQSELSKPRRLDEQYSAGFCGGAYMAYSDAAQEIQNVLNAAVTEVQPDES